ncbi:ribonuclease Z [Pleionea sediminis]|uniref:ribonuclease Z n=1 Tax=Pleionea sediminis TaxID=2569479 RepID=UPI001185473A|nr:ribonuclease Z [Pleionea sediminis]
MEVCFLGTSSGVPTKSRNVTAIALTESKGKDWYLIDCGEGTQHQLLHTKLSLNALKAIFITHVHGDHCYGLPGLLASAGMSGRKEPFVIVAPKGIKEWVESVQTHTQLYLPYEIQFIDTEHYKAQIFGQFKVQTTALSHRVPSYAYSFTEHQVDMQLDFEKLKASGLPQGPLWGKLKSGIDVEFEGKKYLSRDFVRTVGFPRKVVIGGDNDSPELLKETCKESHILIHESTYTEEMKIRAKEVGHSYAKQVASFAQSLSIPNLILTHFSPRYQLDSSSGDSLETLRSEAESVYDGNLNMASDFECYRLDKSGKVIVSKTA